MTDDNKEASAGTMEETKPEETTEEQTETMNVDNDNQDNEEDQDNEDNQDGGDDDANDDNDDTQKSSGGGKSNYRDNQKGGRRYTPYPRNNRAVYHQSDDSDPSCRVYVGNLAWGVTWKDLKAHMEKCGCVIVRADVLATPDGRSKGCGIVEFETEEGAKRALMLNDSELMERQIFVREDRESGSGGGYYTQQPGPAPSGGATGGDSESGSTGGVRGEKQDCRVYCGNLSWDVSWQDLKDHMRSAGEVSFAEVMQEPDGRSKGCGVVEFKSSEEAKVAIETLNDSDLKGRMIFVREDRETGGGRGGGGGGAFHGGRGGGSRGGNSTSVYVGNLAYETSWQDLKDHMRQAGNVDQANVLQSDEGRSKGCGIVMYQNSRDAVRAINELQNSVLHGRPIFVREDREKGGRGGGRGGRGGRGRGRGGRGGRGGGGYYNEESNGTQLFVNNLSYDTEWRELKDHFRQCGDVERVEVIVGPDGRKKGFGTVRFYKADDATKAIETLNGVELQGRDLEVRHDNKSGGRR